MISAIGSRVVAFAAGGVAGCGAGCALFGFAVAAGAASPLLRIRSAIVPRAGLGAVAAGTGAAKACEDDASCPGTGGCVSSNEGAGRVGGNCRGEDGTDAGAATRCVKSGAGWDAV